jgi:hypothetical protein
VVFGLKSFQRREMRPKMGVCHPLGEVQVCGEVRPKRGDHESFEGNVVLARAPKTSINCTSPCTGEV